MPENEIPVAPMVQHCASLLREQLEPPGGRSGLVAGCGSGDEIVYLRRAFRTRSIVGLDVDPNFSPAARAEGCVLTADAQNLPFPADTFDFAAAFHSLEHVGNPRVVLAELRRVLRSGAPFYVGVPNRSRLVGYLGSFDATPWQKLMWNLTDYAARIRGRFRNEEGAHAGFEGQELVQLLGAYFGDVQLLTREYLRFKYGNRMPKPLLSFLLAPSVINYSAPAHYALCRK
jgi:SAM-dependent methyltransferase